MGGQKSDRKREAAMAHGDCVAPGTPTTPQERGFADCPCPKKCTLHGDCLPCAAYHGRNNGLPRCRR